VREYPTFLVGIFHLNRAPLFYTLSSVAKYNLQGAVAGGFFVFSAADTLLKSETIFHLKRG
jgi:hypothetical protein